ncbi:MULTISPECIES: esterase/lipase family protein [unclassified Nocardioides]|uniref:esterase/lipase family protein n=1 Tax=unclassified Nocardioides TaxID=2615069 RepID=UPI00301471EB
MSQNTLASFLLPAGFARPGVGAVLREASLVGEAGRHVVRRVGDRRVRHATPYGDRAPERFADPVVLVPGFLAGDLSLSLMSTVLRQRGFRTYRSHIRANVGCTLNAAAQLEARLESIAMRRGSRVQVVGHSLGGMLARGVAVRRPDLVSGIVTMGSPMLAPGAHHLALTASVDVLVRLSRAGLPGLMSEECVGGACARQSFDESREPLADDVAFTAIYSRRDGIVDWRACVDPIAVPIEVTASHVGMAVDPRVVDHVSAALATQLTPRSAVEVDRGVSA